MMEVPGEIVTLFNPADKIRALKNKVRKLEAEIATLTSRLEETKRIAAEREQDLKNRIKYYMSKAGVASKKKIRLTLPANPQETIRRPETTEV